MYDSETDEVVAVTELVGVYFDTARRASELLPEIVRERAAKLLLNRSDVEDRERDVRKRELA